MGDPERTGESKVAQFADWAIPAMGRAMGDPPLPGKPAGPPEDEWKVPTGPIADVEGPADAATSGAVAERGSLLRRLTHRG
jgi:hypothetical protein